MNFGFSGLIMNWDWLLVRMFLDRVGCCEISMVFFFFFDVCYMMFVGVFGGGVFEGGGIWGVVFFEGWVYFE